jgi:hypothetical protein
MVARYEGGCVLEPGTDVARGHASKVANPYELVGGDVLKESWRKTTSR